MERNDRLLRHIPTGILHAYQDIYAIRPDFEEVINVEARVIEGPAPVVEKPRRKKADAQPAESADTPVAG